MAVLFRAPRAATVKVGGQFLGGEDVTSFTRVDLPNVDALFYILFDSIRFSKHSFLYRCSRNVDREKNYTYATALWQCAKMLQICLSKN